MRTNGVVVGLGVGLGLGLLVLTGCQDQEAGTARPGPPTTSTTSSASSASRESGQACVDGVDGVIVVYFEQSDADSRMRAAADRLRDDDRIAELSTRTQEEAYEWFVEVFADQPELVEQVRPEALPASVRVTPAEGVEASELATALTEELPDADEVDDQPCQDLPVPTT